MQGNRSLDSKPEVALRSLLHRTGLRFRKHVRPLQGLRCKPDVVFPKEQVAVFVDGCFWHNCPTHGRIPARNTAYWSAKLARNSARDREATKTLQAAGWLVIRAWEHEPPALVARRVSEAVLARRR
jgi:DNA mismatch endonuclease, patch repair protein